MLTSFTTSPTSYPLIRRYLAVEWRHLINEESTTSQMSEALDVEGTAYKRKRGA
jgi:hypothetical protein